MKTLLLSPHLDDAVLSAGQFLVNQPGCDVLTVFAGIPDWGKGVVTPYDQKCGFTSSRRAMEARRLEDRDAIARLRCDPYFWEHYLDSQYLADERDRDGLPALAADIVDFVRRGEYELVLAPLGLLHPDHEFLADAVLLARDTLPADVYLWEDLPNRVLYPEVAQQRLSQLPPATLHAPGGAGPMGEKIRALLCYRSQLGTGDLDFNLLCVPERFWKLTRKDGDATA